MGVSTTSGARLYIGSAPVNTDDIEEMDYATALAYYEGLSWTEVKRIENFGDHGDSSELATFNDVTARRSKKMKTIRDAGTMSIVVGRDAGDPGQQAMNDAEGDDYDYPFKIVYKDAEDPTYTDSIDYFGGQVLSRSVQMGGVTDVTKRTYNIGINTEITEDESAVAVIPANTTRPTISGTSLAVGATLTADPGVWTNSPASHGYQWQADTSGNGTFVSIGGATSQTYVLAAGQTGDAVRVQVTGTNPAGTSAAVNSLPVGLVV
jgi:hypothetical protein